MSFVLKPWQLLLITLAGWVNLCQQQRIDFQDDEIQILLPLLGKRRLRLTDEERRRLAAKGKLLGRKALQQITTIVTPDTIFGAIPSIHQGRMSRPNDLLWRRDVTEGGHSIPGTLPPRTQSPGAGQSVLAKV